LKRPVSDIIIKPYRMWLTIFTLLEVPSDIALYAGSRLPEFINFFVVGLCSIISFIGMCVTLWLNGRAKKHQYGAIHQEVDQTRWILGIFPMARAHLLTTYRPWYLTFNALYISFLFIAGIAAIITQTKMMLILLSLAIFNAIAILITLVFNRQTRLHQH